MADIRQTLPAFTNPELVNALNKLQGQNSDSASQVAKITNFKIPHVFDYNRELLAIAYTIASSLPKNEADYDKSKIFIVSEPGEEIVYTDYYGMSVLDMLKKMTGVKEDQHTLIAKYLEILLCYIDSITPYIHEDIENLEEEVEFVELDPEEQEDEYFTDEEEDFD